MRRESDHLIASGIILALDLIALTATIATGGAAAPAVLGVVVSCAGGLNAITKGASDYQDNIIMVHQCLNSGTVSGSDPDYIGGIAGQLRSRGYISDCFNSGTGPGGGGQLVGDIGEDFTTKNSLGVADLSSWEDLLGNFSNVNKFETVEGLYYYQSSSKDYSHATSLSKEKLGKSDDSRIIEICRIYFKHLADHAQLLGNLVTNILFTGKKVKCFSIFKGINHCLLPIFL